MSDGGLWSLHGTLLTDWDTHRCNANCRVEVGDGGLPDGRWIVVTACQLSMHGALLKDWETHRCDVKLGRGWRIGGEDVWSQAWCTSRCAAYILGDT